MNKHIRERRREDRYWRRVQKEISIEQKIPMHKIYKLYYGNKNPKYHHRWQILNGLIRRNIKLIVRAIYDFQQNHPEAYKYYCEHKEELDKKEDED